MDWEEFNQGETDITNDMQVLTNIRCPKCGRVIFMDASVVLTSYPAQYPYWCVCGWSGTSYKSWLKYKPPYKTVVGFNMDQGSTKAIFEKEETNEGD